MKPHLRTIEILLLSKIDESPSYGYSLQKEFSYPASSIYYALRKLHELGLTRIIRENRATTPSANRHTITKKGGHVLSKMLQIQITETHTQSERLLSLYRKERNILVHLFTLRRHSQSGTQFHG